MEGLNGERGALANIYQLSAQCAGALHLPNTKTQRATKVFSTQNLAPDHPVLKSW